MEYLIFVGAIFAYVVICYIYGIHNTKKEQVLFKEKVKEQYGSYPTKQYTLEQYDRISHYSEYKQMRDSSTTHNRCDEITWNDLEMEELFQAMNHTYSSAGEEYLYEMLHNLVTDIEVLEGRRKRINQYQQEETLRIQLLSVYKELGTTGKFSIVDYLDYLGSVSKTNNNSSYGMIVLLLTSIFFIFFDGLIGSMLTIGMICIQMGRYFKRKREIEPYFTSVGYLLRLIKAGRIISTMEVPILQKEQEKIKQLLSYLKGFTRNTTFICGGGTALSNNSLNVVSDYINMLFHFDLIQFNGVLTIVEQEKERILQLLELVGSIEAEIAIAYYRAWLPYYCEPVFYTQSHMVQEELYMPLIPNAVSNTIDTNKSILLTGSNASGKSTFLRSVAINGILAQTIVTCSAQKVQMPFMHIYSSIAIRDNLKKQDSYYLAEIKSIKRILDVADTNKLPVLCFIDEVLRGTNTIERIAASTQILKLLSQKNVMCFAATHDIELTQLLKNLYDNYHFQEEIHGDDISFDYLIQQGTATSRNAIFLLKTLGYDSQIIEQSMEMANRFLEKGVWEIANYTNMIP